MGAEWLLCVKPRTRTEFPLRATRGRVPRFVGDTMRVTGGRNRLTWPSVLEQVVQFVVLKNSVFEHFFIRVIK